MGEDDDEDDNLSDDAPMIRMNTLGKKPLLAAKKMRFNVA